MLQKRNTNGDRMIQDYLKSFGLTGQEASIYEALLINGEMTGYEVAKETGISRSYVYGAMSALVDKGAAYQIEGESTKYVAVDMEQFCENTLHDLRDKAEYLKKHAPKRREVTDGYVTIAGKQHIHNKVHDMLSKCEKRFYFMAPSEILGEFEDQISELTKKGLKVVLLTDSCYIKDTICYETKTEPYQIRLITDSKYVLTGTYGEGESDACLYSAQPNLVAVMKEALGNRISLIEIELEEKEK